MEMRDQTAMELLRRLSSSEAEPAWRDFLARYSPLIMRVVRRYGLSDDRGTECFVYVCGALSDQDFRRLRSFRSDGPARFNTWLMAVVANLCVDWCRKVQGRRRPSRGLSRLPDLDQHVYRCIYERGLSRAQCVEALRPRFPGLGESTVAEINARLFTMLSPQQRWRASAGVAIRNPSGSVVLGHEDPASQVAAPGPGPDELAAGLQEQGRLQDALSKLTPAQRLLVRLRYEQNLTLVEIARLTAQSDPFRVDRQIRAAIGELSSLMGELRSGPGRKNR